MTEGNWRLGMFVDEDASDEQMEKLSAVFGGRLPRAPYPALSGALVDAVTNPLEAL